MLAAFIQDAWRDNRPLIRLLLVTLLALAVAWGAYALVGHRLIESAHRGERFESLGRLFGDRDTRPVESYFERVETLLVILSAYFLIAVATVGVLVARPRNDVATRVWLVAVGAAILATMSFVKPTFHGDGPEYLLMTESLVNHGTPDLRDGDIESLQRLEKEFGFSFSRRDPRQYYFESASGAIYSYHFWLYPAVAVPVKLALRALEANEGKALQITNAVLLVLALFFGVCRSGFDETQRRVLAMLAVFCPALWFVYWPHPEVFSYSLVILSLASASREKWCTAVLWAAVASTQNQPLLFFVAYAWIRGLIASRQRRRGLLFLSLAGAPALLPNLFFYVNFRVGSLLAREATSLSNVGVKRALELFFDPNIGMLPYLPVVVALYVALFARDLLIVRRPTTSVQFGTLLFVMALACTPTYLWNHGTTGPSRYVIWMLPFVFYAVVEAVGGLPRWRPVLLPTIGVALVLQGAMIVTLGGLTPPITQMSHTYMARFILDRAPALYNPTPEIFAVRTSHRMPEITYKPSVGYRAALPPTPIVYRRGDRCRKALIWGDEWPALDAVCGATARPVDRSLADAYVYVNF